MADALEAAGQRMLHEAVDKPARLHAHHLLAVAVGRIAHPETNNASLHAQDALVGDGHSVRVAAHVSPPQQAPLARVVTALQLQRTLPSRQ